MDFRSKSHVKFPKEAGVPQIFKYMFVTSLSNQWRVALKPFSTSAISQSVFQRWLYLLQAPATFLCRFKPNEPAIRTNTAESKMALGHLMNSRFEANYGVFQCLP